MEGMAHDEASGAFPSDPAGLEEASPAITLALNNGDRLELGVTPVAKRIDGSLVRMLAYNGSIPGPTIRIRQGSEIEVQLRNEGDVDTTIHWHGIRLENRYDGVPHDTQRPVGVGEA